MSLDDTNLPDANVTTSEAITRPDAARADRDPVTGRLLPGNAIARRHGLYASRIAEELEAERVAFLEQSITDDGGLSEISIRRRSQHEYRARLHVHIAQLSSAIEQFGLFDGRGRLRTAWLQRLEGLMALARSIDASLGLERRQKRVDSFADAIAQEPARE
jgi:hypothetical protein